MMFEVMDLNFIRRDLRSRSNRSVIRVYKPRIEALSLFHSLDGKGAAFIWKNLP